MINPSTPDETRPTGSSAEILPELAEDSVLLQPTEIPPADNSPCPTDRHYRIHLDEGCDAEDQTIGDFKIVWGGSLADAIITGTITSERGLVSNLTLERTAILKDSYVTNVILNKGLMKDFIFVGARITGGTLAGKIIIASRVHNSRRDFSPRHRDSRRTRQRVRHGKICWQDYG